MQHWKRNNCVYIIKNLAAERPLILMLEANQFKPSEQVILEPFEPDHTLKKKK
jgi:hypothetical protein